jgi:hypothetical protein
VFLISGACALAFETLWFHQARLAFGQSVWASSLVLSAFMAGMGLGNFACARNGDRVRNALETSDQAQSSSTAGIYTSVGEALKQWRPQHRTLPEWQFGDYPSPRGLLTSITAAGHDSYDKPALRPQADTMNQWFDPGSLRLSEGFSNQHSSTRPPTH